jgi:hypothetical protein
MNTADISLGQSCILARRLVEAGVRCVLIDHTNWDTHYSNFSVLKNDLLPHLDSAMSTLFRDLHDRGLLEKTMVLVTGALAARPGSTKTPDAITGPQYSHRHRRRRNPGWQRRRSF